MWVKVNRYTDKEDYIEVTDDQAENLFIMHAASKIEKEDLEKHINKLQEIYNLLYPSKKDSEFETSIEDTEEPINKEEPKKRGRHTNPNKMLKQDNIETK